MADKKPYYITTAIAYTSGKPHIGNTYEIILADAIARYKRSQGYDVFFQTGTDEHGQKIELKAEEAGVTPKEFVDNVSGEIKKIWDLMDTSYDKFIRTTDEDHEKQVQKIFKKLYDLSLIHILVGTFTENGNTVGISVMLEMFVGMFVFFYMGIESLLILNLSLIHI